MPHVLEIENATSRFSWREEDFLYYYRKTTDHQFKVVQYGDNIIAFAVYEVGQKEIHILNVAVRPTMQRRGIGMGIMEIIKKEFLYKGRNSMTIEVNEHNNGAIAFLAQYGFMGIRVLRNYYQSRLALEDGYLMRYSTNPTHVINRLRGHFAKLNEAREMFTGTPKLKNAFHQ